MRVAAGLALLLAPAALVHGYVCDYRGTGSTAIFPTYITLGESCGPRDASYCNDNYVSLSPFFGLAGRAAECSKARITDVMLMVTVPPFLPTVRELRQ